MEMNPNIYLLLAVSLTSVYIMIDYFSIIICAIVFYAFMFISYILFSFDGFYVFTLAIIYIIVAIFVYYVVTEFLNKK